MEKDKLASLTESTYGDDKADVDQADARERAARAHFKSYDEDRR